jgi:AraC family transcriptional regulator of adaptative response/methylated-DNA-[protein]-cysteine methyltransferase
MNALSEGTAAMTQIKKRHGAGRLVDVDPRWTAVVARDRRADGSFYYSVETTGVYCKPSCAARLPRRENVRFYVNCEEAERAGFRPCKRCKPNEADLATRRAEIVATACRLIESADEPLKLDHLANAASLSVSYFHRLFRAITGLTPKQYSSAHRAKRLRGELEKSDSVTDAIYAAGYGSSGRFYGGSDQILGMTPSSFRDGGKATIIRFAIGDCSLGSVLVAKSDRGICAIFLGNDPDKLLRELQDRFPKSELIGGDAKFEALVARVVALIESPTSDEQLPLDIRGTAFQMRVWQALKNIPVGSTATYSEIAEKIGSPRSVRAVAGACAANSIAVAIPCHRVVRMDGSLSGYRWGVERKQALLQKERRQ